MNILVNDRTEEINLINPKTNLHYTEDFIIPNSRPEFIWNNEKEMWQLDEENFQWWKEICKKEQIIINAENTTKFRDLNEAILKEYYSCLASNDIETNIEERMKFLESADII